MPAALPAEMKPCQARSVPFMSLAGRGLCDERSAWLMKWRDGQGGGSATTKDEAPYLLEWLAFHRMIGVDLFVHYTMAAAAAAPT
jgi:hypothetical protein